MAGQGVHSSAVIASTAKLGANTSIGPCVVIDDNAEIGANTVVEPHAYIGVGAVIGEDCHIGTGAVVRDGVVLERGVCLGAGVVLGTDGFGYVFDGNTHFKIPQVGGVHLGEDTIVEAGACIDRATTGTTEIGARTHVGPMVMIGHNCAVGEDCQLGFQVGLAGSSRVGNSCKMAPQSGMAMRAELGDNCEVEFRGAVLRKFAEGSRVAGYPARPVAEVKRLEAAVMRLPKLLEQLGK